MGGASEAREGYQPYSRRSPRGTKLTTQVREVNRRRAAQFGPCRCKLTSPRGRLDRAGEPSSSAPLPSEPDWRILAEELDASFLSGSAHRVIECRQRQVASERQFEVCSIVSRQPGLASRCDEGRGGSGADFQECGKAFDIADV